ncbi:hypothetical protein J26TS2_34190 [Shouchella clausii]|uniref:hypothetical protein n=1 Tax=Shouchella tritolerans TaxID=2979466 RepID=UPI0007884D5A|nr:hypothetical protein [Shouchella tritolerans]GIN13552.1 hypothetical protein J26TS2_34190 [Shouchella clausii]
MFENLFTDELATRIGQTVEIATDNNLLEGILLSVTANIVVIITSNGYGPSIQVSIAVSAINFVRFP